MHQTNYLLLLSSRNTNRGRQNDSPPENQQKQNHEQQKDPPPNVDPSEREQRAQKNEPRNVHIQTSPQAPSPVYPTTNINRPPDSDPREQFHYNYRPTYRNSTPINPPPFGFRPHDSTTIDESNPPQNIDRLREERNKLDEQIRQHK